MTYEFYFGKRIMLKRIFSILSLFFGRNLFALEVAITVDDLPVAGKIPTNMSRLELARQMLAIFKKHRISNIYGMVNGESIDKDIDGYRILQEWVDAGQLLGNHTFSHMDIVSNNLKKYINDIQKNELYLSALMHGKILI